MKSDIPQRIRFLLSPNWSTHPEIKNIMQEAACRIMNLESVIDGAKLICANCGGVIERSERESHWETCPKSRSRQIISDLRNELEDLQFAFDVACDDVEMLRGERTKYRKRCEELQQEVAEDEEEIRDWTEKLEQLEAEMDIADGWQPDGELKKTADARAEKLLSMVQQRDDRISDLCREYRELAAAVLSCEPDELASDVTHASLCQEASTKRSKGSCDVDVIRLRSKLAIWQQMCPDMMAEVSRYINDLPEDHPARRYA